MRNKNKKGTFYSSFFIILKLIFLISFKRLGALPLPFNPTPLKNPWFLRISNGVVLRIVFLFLLAPPQWHCNRLCLNNAHRSPTNSSHVCIFLYYIICVFPCQSAILHNSFSISTLVWHRFSVIWQIFSLPLILHHNTYLLF